MASSALRPFVDISIPEPVSPGRRLSNTCSAHNRQTPRLQSPWGETVGSVRGQRAPAHDNSACKSLRKTYYYHHGQARTHRDGHCWPKHASKRQGRGESRWTTPKYHHVDTTWLRAGICYGFLRDA